jgi:hypothetical protein
VNRVLTNGELDALSREISELDAELDWRCPTREGARINWICARLDEIEATITASLRAVRRNSGLRVVNGGGK